MPPGPAGTAPIPRALVALAALACMVAIGAMLVLPDHIKAVGLVYGGF